jgi:cytochrome c553
MLKAHASALLLAALAFATPRQARAADVSFGHEIRPLLAEHCLTCHGRDAEARKGNLRLDLREEALRGVEGRPALAPGQPDHSELMKRIRSTDPAFRMPPPPAAPLSEAQRATLQRWIEQGAPYEEHWSWNPLARPALPPVRDTTWPATAPDHFILAELERAGLRPAPDADRETLLRRLSIDLTGLPPTPAERATFLADTSPDAWSRAIDRLLASPRFGERWARHWLDLVRYAETYGHEFDFEIPDAWRYRDYVVRAFNANVPYDRFVAEQIAGDLLPDARPDPNTGLNESPLGTAFWLLPQGTHAPVDVAQDEAERIANQVEVFGRTFLGLTIACARCHDHKFDAISQRDYFALSGYVKSTRRSRVPLDPQGELAAARTRALADRRALEQSLAAPRPSAALPPPPTDLTRFADFAQPVPAGWRASGFAFARQADEVPALALRGSDRVVALERDITTSDAAGPHFTGTLRSPSFVISHDAVHILARGTGVVIRAIVDGYTLAEENALLFESTTRTLDTRGEWQVVRLGLSRYQGHRAYLEIVDPGPGLIDLGWIAFGPDRGPGIKVPTTAGPESARPALQQLASKPPPLPAFALIAEDGSGWDDRIHLRGNPHTLGDPAPRGFLESLAPKLPPAPADGSGRLELARAVVDPENPLGARVMVNRIWRHLLGRGLAPTPDDLGALGQPPTHPALLDWLAAEFRADWDIKRLIRLIASSRTYRMSATGAPAALAQDPANRLYHQRILHRMDAETLRDALLQLSGRLEPAAGGPSVPTHLTEFMTGRGRPKESGPADGHGRRSLYLATRRNFPDSFLCAFDLPVPTTTVGRRNESNVPALALALLNSPLAHGEANRWGTRMAKAAGAPDARVAEMIGAAFSRTARPDETERALHFLREAAGPRADAWTTDPAAWSDLAHVLFNAKEFVFVD